MTREVGARWVLEDSVVFIVFAERKKPADNDQSRDQRLLGTREEWRLESAGEK